MTNESRGIKKAIILALFILGIFSANAFAGTGGAELQTWYTDISSSLQGFWGKIIAVVFIGIAIILFKGGAIIGGIFMMMLGMSVGTIPDMVDSKFTALAIETHAVGFFESVAMLFH